MIEIDLLDLGDCVLFFLSAFCIGSVLSGIPALIGLVIQGFKKIFNISVEGG